MRPALKNKSFVTPGVILGFLFVGIAIGILGCGDGDIIIGGNISTGVEETVDVSDSTDSTVDMSSNSEDSDDDSETESGERTDTATGTEDRIDEDTAATIDTAETEAENGADSSGDIAGLDVSADTDTLSDSGDVSGEDTEDADEDTSVAATSEDWDMALAVDNQFDVYFGTPYETEGEMVGRGTEWYRQYLFTAAGKKPTDHLYVVTASDRDAAQGFIGTFKNITRGETVVTGDDVWQVFAAGAHEETNPYWPDEWPESELPTQEQVNVAIRFAQENSLWVTPFSDVAYDNNPETNVTDTGVWTVNPWGNHYDDIPDDALWIWYDSGKITDTNGLPAPFAGGNHDEFLIFRVAGRLEIVLE